MSKKQFFSLLSTFASAAVISGSSQGVAAPYIYYYSIQKNEFLVERADGSDSRTLATYVLPDQYSVVAGPGWSPSGKWFAWTSQTTFGSGPMNNVYVVGLDGGSPHAIFSGTFAVGAIDWSPISDILAISYYGDNANSLGKVAIYDAVTNKIIAQISAADIDFPNQPIPDGDQFYIYRQIWSPDGQSIALLTAHNLVILQITGKYDVIPSSGNEVFCKPLSHLFRDRRIAYPYQAKLVIKNTNISTQTIIKLPDEPVATVDWSPDEAYALIYTTPDQQSPKSNLWLLSVANQSLNRLSTDVAYIPTSACPNIYEPYVVTMWNGQGQAIFVSSDRQLWLVTASPPQISKISFSSVGQVPDQSPLRWLNNKLMFMWQSPTTYKSQIDLYDPQTGQAQTVISSVDNLHYFTPLRGTDFAYSQGENAFTTNLSAVTKNKLAFLVSPGDPSAAPGMIFLHPSQNWLFLLDYSSASSHLVNIVNFDGSIQRELGICPANSASCFGWLP